MTTTTPAIPGLVIDDSPGRPAHKPRITFECSAVAVRVALTATNADALAEFERQFHVAMAEADDDFDLGPVEKVIRHWWLRAIHYLDADATAYTAAVVEQLQHGDESALAPKGAR
jgi:hypothetical protein